MDEATVLRLATILAAVLVVVAGAGVARAAMNSKASLWSVLGGLTVAVVIVFVGYVLATTSIYRGY